MTWNLKRSLTLGAVLLVGIVAWWQVRAAPSGSTVRPEIETFQLTTDPEEVILFLEMKGGLGAGHHWTNILTGDGTLHESRESTGKTQTLHLTYVEMEDLVRIAVDGGLIGLDWEALQNKIREKHGGVASMTDSPRINLGISLTGAQTADGQDLGPVSSSFSCVCVPAILAEAHPDIPEVLALDSLIRAVSARLYPDKVRR